VAVIPVDVGVEFALGQLAEIRKLLIEIMNREVSGLTFDKAVLFAKENPLIATIIGSVLSVLLFGERVLEIIKLVRGGDE